MITASIENHVDSMSELRLSYLVGRAGRMLQNRIEEVLDDVGLALPELTALSVLAARPGLSNARLARRGLVTPQAMHKVMRSLEEQGLVSRSAVDGRALEATVTQEGMRMLRRIEPLLVTEEDAFLRPLDSEEKNQFVDMLTRVCGLS